MTGNQDRLLALVEFLTAEVLAQRVCIKQMLFDRMLQQQDPEAALREFSRNTDKLIATAPPELPQRVAVERLSKLIDEVGVLLRKPREG